MIEVVTKYGRSLSFNKTNMDEYKIINHNLCIQGDEELIRNYLTGLLDESDIDELFKGE